MRKKFTKEIYKNMPCYPSEERIRKGPVAVIECAEEIPCNPCELACPFNAIKIGYPITNIPVLQENKCIGCAECVSICPGLAIVILNWNYNEKEASLTIPYELFPLPQKGEIVKCLDREGKYVCDGKVLRVSPPERRGGTSLVTFSFPKKFYDEVRNIKLER